MAAAWSASGRYLAAALVHGWMEIWDLTSVEKVGVFPKIRHSGWLQWFTRISFAPGSEDLLIAGNRDTRLFDWRQGKILKTNTGFGFAISPSGESIAVGFPDGRVMISQLEQYLYEDL